jgi:CDGSH-type Zn-finger protein
VSGCRLTVRSNGPIALEGEFLIVDKHGRPIDLGGRPVVLLCRCGAARSKPFCDGSHNRMGFDSLVEGQPEPEKPR